MAERRGADAPDDVDEYNRDERIETIYQGWGAREMAERIVDLEDELGADVDGICTGMYADVAEAHCEIERLNSILGYYEFRTESEKDSAGVAEWTAVRSIQLMNEAGRQRDRYRLAWLSARRRAKKHHSWWRGARHRMQTWQAMCRQGYSGRYRSAWLSARRRAADEANYALEALDLKSAEITRLTSDRDWWQRGHETAEAQLVYERRENARLRAELADLREAIHEEI
jgi:hypothetical protein